MFTLVTSTSFREPPSCCGLTQTEAVEDALKSIFRMTGRFEPPTTSALARDLGIKPPTVSAMLKRLEDHGLIERGVDHTAVLTAHGVEHARTVIRRHRLLETFLFQILDVPWDEVHADAEVLEHAVGERLLARIDDFLGHPVTDPHGDPIPPATGGYVEQWSQRLDSVEPGITFRIDRVDDRVGAALRYLADIGVRPGVTVEVLERAPFGGPLWLGVDGHRHALGDLLTTVIYGRAVPVPTATSTAGHDLDRRSSPMGSADTMRRRVQ